MNNLFNLGMLRNVRHCPDARANILNGNSIVDCGCEARLYGSKGNYRCEIVRKGAAEGLGEEYDFIIPCILLNGLWWITEAQFHDLVFRHGLTIEEIQSRHDEAVAWQLETMERRGGDFFKRNSVEIHLSDENFMSRMTTFILENTELHIGLNVDKRIDLVKRHIIRVTPFGKRWAHYEYGHLLDSEDGQPEFTLDNEFEFEEAVNVCKRDIAKSQEQSSISL